MYEGTKPGCFGHTRVFSYPATKPDCFGHIQGILVHGYQTGLFWSCSGILVPGYQTRLFWLYSGMYAGTKPGCLGHTRVFTRVPDPFFLSYSSILGYVPEHPQRFYPSKRTLEMMLLRIEVSKGAVSPVYRSLARSISFFFSRVMAPACRFEASI